MRINKTNKIFNSSESSSVKQSQEADKGSIWQKQQKTGSLNGEIEPTKQGREAYNCWVLSTVNGLSLTPWGKDAIKKSIKPDGNGGAEICLYSPEGKKVVYKISSKEIKKGQESNKYSSGDDDMVALELAFEKYFKDFYRREDIAGGNSYECYLITHAITGKHTPVSVVCMPDDVENTILEIEKAPDKYACELSFNSIQLGNDYAIFPGHSYSLKRIEEKKGQKYVVVVNPQKSDDEVRLSIDDFKKYIFQFTVIEQDREHKNPKIKSDKDGKHLLNKTSVKANISRYLVSKNSQKLKSEIAKINKDNVAFILYKQGRWSKDDCPLLRQLDKYAYGWGNGKQKKELIEPILNAVYERAKEIGVDKHIIDEVKKNCDSELNAKLFTDIDVIVEEILKLISKINFQDQLDLQAKYAHVLR